VGAPNRVAILSLLSRRSTAITGYAPTIAANWTTFSPTPPTPNTRRTRRSRPWHRCDHAERVVTAQPSSGALFLSIEAGTGVTRFSETTAYSLKVVTQPAFTFLPCRNRPASAPACRCGPPVHDDRIARLAGGHAGAGLDHDRERLVSEQMRQELVRALDGVDLVDLRATDARCPDPDQNLPVLEAVGQGDLVDHQRLARLDQDRRLRGLHIHDVSRLFEIDEFVVAAIAELFIEPDPLRGVQDRLGRQRQHSRLCSSATVRYPSP